MDKPLRRGMTMVCLLLMLGGCAPVGESPSPSPVQLALSSWPQNAYTQALPQPAQGTPAYAISDPSMGYYAIFLDGVTRQRGQQYLETLSAQGFERQIGQSSGVAVGELWRKGAVTVSVSISDQTLGLYIHLDPEA